MGQLALVAHNLRSSLNVGSLLRTCDGLGISQVWLTGHTPYPHHVKDTRLPHISARIHRRIAKTALGAEKLVRWQHDADISAVLRELKSQGYIIVALEQADNALSLPDFKPPAKLALIVGREVEGLEEAVLAQCDHVVEIPMLGQKESFNVASAAAIALYHCRFYEQIRSGHAIIVE